MSHSSQNREHFRLRYPLPARPRLTVNGLEFSVTEISESGSKVLLDTHHPSLFDGDPEGVFCFHDGTSIKVNASFVRLAEEEAVLKLSPDTVESHHGRATVDPDAVSQGKPSLGGLKTTYA